MFSLPSFFALLLPLPALGDRQSLQRRRSLSLLDLPHHLRKDLGMNDLDGPSDDPRWAQRIARDER